MQTPLPFAQWENMGASGYYSTAPAPPTSPPPPVVPALTRTLLTEDEVVSRMVKRAVTSVGHGDMGLKDITEAINAEGVSIVTEGAADRSLVERLVMSPVPFAATLLCGGVPPKKIKSYLHTLYPGKEGTLSQMKSDVRYNKYFDLNSFIRTCSHTLSPKKKPQPPPPSSSPPPPKENEVKEEKTLYNYEKEDTFKEFIKFGEVVYMRRVYYFNGDMRTYGYELYSSVHGEKHFPVFLNEQSEPITKSDYIKVSVTCVDKKFSERPLNRYCIMRGGVFYIITGDVTTYG